MTYKTFDIQDLDEEFWSKVVFFRYTIPAVLAVRVSYSS